MGVELAQARERVEVVGLPTVKVPGAVGAVATLTEVVAVLVPFAFVAVRVKRVVAPSAGVVVLVPVTVPTPWSMESEVALLTVQLKVEVPFRATVAGEAEKAEMAGTEAQETEMLVTLLDTTVPEAFDTVHVWPEGCVRTVTL